MKNNLKILIGLFIIGCLAFVGQAFAQFGQTRFLSNVSCPTSTPTPTPTSTPTPLPFLVGANMQASSGSTSITFTVPPQVVVNQVAIVQICTEGTPTISTPAGWSTLLAVANNTVQAQAYYKVIGAGDTAGNTEAFTWSGSEVNGGVLGVWGNINHTSPIDAGPSIAYAASATASSITTSLANDLVVLLNCHDNNSNFDSPPNTFSNFGSMPTNASAEGGVTGYMVKVTAGATGTAAGGGSSHALSALVALAQGS